MLFRKSILFFAVLLFWTHSIQAQDSVRKILIEQTLVAPTPWPYPWPTPNPLPWNLDWSRFTGTYALLIQSCGESYYDNGAIQSRCECNKDSVLHGKSVYWDQSGRISYVQLYQNGQLYKFKSYQEGKLSYVENYSRDAEGFQKKHGNRISYSGAIKTVEKYHYGILQGTTTAYENNKRISEIYFDNGVKTSGKEWYDSGELKSVSQFDLQERRTTYEVFDKNGNTIETEYNRDGKPIGTWVKIEPLKNHKTIKVHENGSILTYDSLQGSILLEHKEFANGVIQLDEKFWDDGAPMFRFQFDPNGVDGKQTSWNEEGTMIENYTVRNDQFIGKGFYTQQGSTMHILGPDQPDAFTPMIRWTLRNGDTIRMDYHRNSVSDRSMHLITNYYKTLSDGRNVRNGKWYLYDGNYLSKVLRYVDGNLNERAVYYTNNDGNPIPETIGFYDLGVKISRWEHFTDSTYEVFHYEKGVLSGSHECYRIIKTSDPESAKTLLLSENYMNNERTGAYNVFYTNGSLKISGNYLNGKKHSEWSIFHENGDIFREAEFENGLLQKSWYEWTPKRNGKLKKVRIDFEFEEPSSSQRLQKALELIP